MTASYYPDPFLQKLQDIDVFVKKEQFCEAVMRCADSGYLPFILPEDNEECSHFIKNGITIHLQRRLRLYSDNEKNELLNKWLQESNIEKTVINNYKIPVPQAWIEGILQLSLIKKSIEQKEITRKQLNDWNMFVSKYLSDDAWPGFKQHADQLELADIAKSITRLGGNNVAWCRETADDLTDLRIVEDSENNVNKKVYVSRSNPLKQLLRSGYSFIKGSSLRKPFYFFYDLYYVVSYRLMGKSVLQPEVVEDVERNVTFIYKSFNRQKQAIRLYKSIKTCYPEARIIIVDDSNHPLELHEVIRLPFNSGLSRGLAVALEKVQTPYVMRLDDDMLLIPNTNVHKELEFLEKHPDVDLVAVMADYKKPKEYAAKFAKIKMRKTLQIPAGTLIDGKEVVYKTPNCFLARTEKMRIIGYDVNLRINEHHDFFFRAAGRMVCVLDPESSIMHCHNLFEGENYEKYRYDAVGAAKYLRNKHASKYQMI